MSMLSNGSMTNGHGHDHSSGLLTQLNDTVHVWWQRYEKRRELAQWSDRDLHDIGISRSDIASETEKPFWRA